MTDAFEDKYNKKLEDLEKYVPFLEKMINHLKNTNEKSRQVQLTKMESLYSMITDRSKKYKFDILLRCEEVIEKLQCRMKPNLASKKVEKQEKEEKTITKEALVESKDLEIAESKSKNKDSTHELSKKTIQENTSNDIRKSQERIKNIASNLLDFKQSKSENNDEIEVSNNTIPKNTLNDIGKEQTNVKSTVSNLLDFSQCKSQNKDNINEVPNKIVQRNTSTDNREQQKSIKTIVSNLPNLKEYKFKNKGDTNGVSNKMIQKNISSDIRKKEYVRTLVPIVPNFNESQCKNNDNSNEGSNKMIQKNTFNDIDKQENIRTVVPNLPDTKESTFKNNDDGNEVPNKMLQKNTSSDIRKQENIITKVPNIPDFKESKFKNNDTNEVYNKIVQKDTPTAVRKQQNIRTIVSNLSDFKESKFKNKDDINEVSNKMVQKNTCSDIRKEQENIKATVSNLQDIRESKLKNKDDTYEVSDNIVPKNTSNYIKTHAESMRASLSNLQDFKESNFRNSDNKVYKKVVQENAFEESSRTTLYSPNDFEEEEAMDQGIYTNFGERKYRPYSITKASKQKIILPLLLEAVRGSSSTTHRSEYTFDETLDPRMMSRYSPHEYHNYETQTEDNYYNNRAGCSRYPSTYPENDAHDYNRSNSYNKNANTYKDLEKYYFFDECLGVPERQERETDAEYYVRRLRFFEKYKRDRDGGRSDRSRSRSSSYRRECHGDERIRSVERDDFSSNDADTLRNIKEENRIDKTKRVTVNNRDSDYEDRNFVLDKEVSKDKIDIAFKAKSVPDEESKINFVKSTKDVDNEAESFKPKNDIIIFKNENPSQNQKLVKINDDFIFKEKKMHPKHESDDRNTITYSKYDKIYANMIKPDGYTSPLDSLYGNDTKTKKFKIPKKQTTVVERTEIRNAEFMVNKEAKKIELSKDDKRTETTMKTYSIKVKHKDNTEYENTKMEDEYSSSAGIKKSRIKKSFNIIDSDDDMPIDLCENTANSKSLKKSVVLEKDIVYSRKDKSLSSKNINQKETKEEINKGRSTVQLLQKIAEPSSSKELCALSIKEQESITEDQSNNIQEQESNTEDQLNNIQEQGSNIACQLSNTKAQQASINKDQLNNMKEQHSTTKDQFNNTQEISTTEDQTNFKGLSNIITTQSNETTDTKHQEMKDKTLKADNKASNTTVENVKIVEETITSENDKAHAKKKQESKEESNKENPQTSNSEHVLEFILKNFKKIRKIFESDSSSDEEKSSKRKKRKKKKRKRRYSSSSSSTTTSSSDTDSRKHKKSKKEETKATKEEKLKVVATQKTKENDNSENEKIKPECEKSKLRNEKPKPKSKKKKPTNEEPEAIATSLDTSDANLLKEDKNSSTDITTSSKSSTKQKINVEQKPRKSELDILHEDIKETWVGKDIMRSTGKRTCTVSKDDIEHPLKKPSRDDLITNAAKLRVLLHRHDISKYLTNTVSNTRRKSKIIEKQNQVVHKRDNKTELVRERRSPRKTDLVPERKSPRKTDSIQERKSPRLIELVQEKKSPRLTELVQEKKSPRLTELLLETKSPQNTDLIPEKKSLRSRDVVHEKISNEPKQTEELPISKPPIKKRKITTSIQELHVETEKDSADEFVPKKDILPVRKVAVRNISIPLHDRNYFVKAERTYCRLCPFRGKLITVHYKTKHKDHEILTSRIDPLITEKLIQNSRIDNYESITLIDEPRQKYPYICPFCPTKLMVDYTFNFYDHLTSHTGEYRYRCDHCDYEWHNMSGLTHHYVRHNSENKPLPRPAPPNSTTYVFGYVCNKCFYIQTLFENMTKHVTNYHENKADIVKINLNLVGLDAEKNDEVKSTVTDECNDTDATVNSVLEVKIEESEDADTNNVHEEVKVEDNQIQVYCDSDDNDNKDETAIEKSLMAFICDAEIEDKNVEEKRLEKMNKILENVNIPRTSIADKIQNKLKSIMSDSSKQLPNDKPLQLKVTSISKLRKPTKSTTPEILNKTRPITVDPCFLLDWETNGSSKNKSIERMPSIQKRISDRSNVQTCDVTEKISASLETPNLISTNLNNRMGAEVVAQKSCVPISNIINRLQDNLQPQISGKNNLICNDTVINQNEKVINMATDSNVLPPLTHYKELTNKNTDKNCITKETNQIDFSIEYSQPSKKIITFNGKDNTVIPSIQDTEAIVENDILQEAPSSEVLPPLSYYKDLVPKEKPEVILQAGSIKLLKRQSGTILFACFVPRCIFCTDKPDVFETHCKVTHANIRFNIWLCSGCNGKFGTDGTLTTLIDVFKHICNAHGESFKSIDGFIDFPIENQVADMVGDSEKASNENSAVQSNTSDAKYRFVITSVNSSAKESPQSIFENFKTPIGSSILSSKPLQSLPSTLETLNSPPPLQLIDDIDVLRSSTDIQPSTSNEITPKKDYIRPVPLFKLLASEDNTDNSQSEENKIIEISNKADDVLPIRKTAYATNCLLDPAKIAHFYKCPSHDCTFSSFFHHELLRHIAEHPVTKIFCLYCDSVMYITTFMEHLEKHHFNCIYSCSNCFYRASNVTFVRVHIEMAHKNANKVMIVATPKETMPKPYKENNEILPPIRNMIQPYFCAAKHCYMKTIFSSLFLDHYKVMHSYKKEKMICGYCDASLTKSMIFLHYWTKHQIFPYHCRYCFKGSKSLNTLVEHQATVHRYLPLTVISRKHRVIKKCGDEEDDEYLKLYIINEVSYNSTIQSSNSTIIEDVSTDDSNNEFPNTDFTSPQIEAVNIKDTGAKLKVKAPDAAESDPLFINSENPAEFTCELCAKIFNTEDELRQHKCSDELNKSKTNQILPQILVCPLCNSNFPDVEALKKHSDNIHPKNSFDRRSFPAVSAPGRRTTITLIDGTIYPSCKICNAIPLTEKICEHIVTQILPHEQDTPLCGKVVTQCVEGGSKSDTSTRLLLTAEARIIPVFVQMNIWECGGQNCRRLWGDLTRLKHHVNTVHHSEKTFRCHHCNISFDFDPQYIEKDMLLKHVQLHGPTLYGCDYCPYLDNKKKSLELHITKFHPKEPKIYIVYRDSYKERPKADSTEPEGTLLNQISLKTQAPLKTYTTRSSTSLLKKSLLTTNTTFETSTFSMKTDVNSSANNAILIDSSGDESDGEDVKKMTEGGNSFNDTTIVNTNDNSNGSEDEIIVLDDDDDDNGPLPVQSRSEVLLPPGFNKPNGPNMQPSSDTYRCPLCKYVTIFAAEFVDHLSEKQDEIRRLYLDAHATEDDVINWAHALTIYQSRILFFWRDTNVGIERSCRFCPVLCDKRHIFSHELHHLDINNKPFQCTECPYSSFSKQSIQLHINSTHRQETPRKLYKEVNADNYLIKPVMSMSINDTFLLSITKPSDFEHYFGLLEPKHIKIPWCPAKNADRPYKCSKCPKRFQTINVFDTHNLLQHKNTSNYLVDKKMKCTQCAQFLSTQQELRHHIKTHYHLYKCRYCNFTAYNLRLLRKHYFDEHDKEEFNYFYDFLAEKELDITLRKKHMTL